MILNKDDNEKDIKDGISTFNENDLFKKKENLYLLKVFGLSIPLYLVVGSILTTNDGSISYFLSLITTVLIVNGYDKAKKENKQ